MSLSIWINLGIPVMYKIGCRVDCRARNLFSWNTPISIAGLDILWINDMYNILVIFLLIYMRNYPLLQILIRITEIVDYLNEE